MKVVVVPIYSIVNKIAIVILTKEESPGKLHSLPTVRQIQHDKNLRLLNNDHPKIIKLI